MEGKIIRIKDCLECPKFMKCKPSKALTPRQRFQLKVQIGVSGILKGCPLEDYKPTNNYNRFICPKCNKVLRESDGYNSDPQLCDDPHLRCDCGFKIYFSLEQIIKEKP